MLRKIYSRVFEDSNGRDGSRKLKFPDFKTTVQDGGKVVSLRHRMLLPPGKYM